MSRSFKKVAGYVDRNPFMKRYSNKSLRKASRNSLQAHLDFNQYDDKVSSFSCFKRCSVSSYDICDYRSLYFDKYELLADYGGVLTWLMSYRELMSGSVDKNALRWYYRYLGK